MKKQLLSALLVLCLLLAVLPLGAAADGEQCPHAHTEIRSALAPSCEKDGYSGFVFCTDCDTCIQTGTQLKALGHNIVWEKRTEATETVPGEKVRVCTRCHQEYGIGYYLLTPLEDVPEDAYYHDAVMWNVESGYIFGKAPGLFVPNDTCTRAEAVTILWRASGKPQAKNPRNPFKDVKKGSYYYDAVMWAVEAGVTTGVSRTSFAPNKTVTRGQFVTFLYRARNIIPHECPQQFQDVPKGMYCYDAVNWAGITSVAHGTAPGIFSPNQSCRRGQVATLMLVYAR